MYVHVFRNRIQQAGGASRVEILVEVYLEHAFVTPELSLVLFGGVDDDATKGLAPHKFFDQFLGSVES
jgi:hypothetical protein